MKCHKCPLDIKPCVTAHKILTKNETHALLRDSCLSMSVENLKFPLRSVFFLMLKEKEDKASLQAEVQHLREDNLRLQEESQNATEKLKKFTEWVFNTIDMN